MYVYAYIYIYIYIFVLDRARLQGMNAESPKPSSLLFARGQSYSPKRRSCSRRERIVHGEKAQGEGGGGGTVWRGLCLGRIAPSWVEHVFRWSPGLSDLTDSGVVVRVSSSLLRLTTLFLAC